MDFDKLFEVAKAKGMEDIQISFNTGKKLSVEIFQSEVESYEIAEDSSLSIKGIYKGKMAKYYTEIMDDSMIESIVDRLIENATVIDSMDEVEIYAGDESYEEVNGLFNEELATIPVEDKINALLKLESKIKDLDDRVNYIETFYEEMENNVFMYNSKGLKLEKQANMAYLGANVIVKTETDQRQEFYYDISNDFSDFDLDVIASNAVSKAANLLGATPIESDNYEIVLDNVAATSLLSVYTSIFSSDAVQKGMSMLKGKLGEVIASDVITIVDDPFMPKRIKSGAFDDDGVSTKYKEIVSDGKLNMFLYNLKTAKKDQVKSTGNGFHGRVAPTNFYIKPKETTTNELIESVKKGFFVTGLQGTHAGANAISGEFSLQSTGYLIEDGKLTQPVCLVTIAGNFFDLLKDVVAVGDNVRFSFSGIGSPSLKIKSLAVSGK